MSTFYRTSFWFHRNWLEPRHFTFSSSNFSRGQTLFLIIFLRSFRTAKLSQAEWKCGLRQKASELCTADFLAGARTLARRRFFFLSFTQTTIGSTTKCLRLWASSHRRRGESDSRKTHFLDDVRRRGKSLELSRVHTQHGSSAFSNDYELGFWENSQVKNVNKKNQSDDVNKR